MCRGGTSSTTVAFRHMNKHTGALLGSKSAVDLSSSSFKFMLGIRDSKAAELRLDPVKPHLHPQQLYHSKQHLRITTHTEQCYVFISSL